MASAPLPKPRAIRSSQEPAGNRVDLPPPPSFPPPNRPHAPPNELEHVTDGNDYVNSDSFVEGLQGTDGSKSSAPAPEPPDDSPRTGLKPKNKAPPPPPGARGNKSSNSPVMTTRSHAPPQPQSLPQLNDPAPPKVTSPTPAKSLIVVTTPNTKFISALPTRPPPPPTTRPQSVCKAPVSPAPNVSSPSAGDTPTDADGGGGGGGKGSEDAAGLKDISLKPKRQAPPRPPGKGGDQTDSADSSDGSQHKEGVVKGGAAKEDVGKGEEPKWKQGIEETGADVVKATTQGAKVKPFSKVGRVALPGMIASGEKQEAQSTSSADVSSQPGDMSRTTDVSRQPGDMSRTTDVSRQPGDISRTTDVSRQPGDMSRTTDVSRQPGDMSRTTDVSRQSGDMSRTTDVSRQLGDISKLADSSVMLWDMANMGIFSIELHRGLHNSIGLVIVTGKLKCTTGGTIDGIFIQRVLPNTPASKDGRVQRGDMLLEVANRSTVGVSIEEATRMLREAAEDVKLKIGRPPDGAVSLSAEDLHDNTTLPPEVPSNEAVEQLKLKLKAELQTSLEAQAAQFSVERKAVQSELEKLKRELEAANNEHTQFLRMEQQKISELAQALASITMEKLKADRELEAARSTLAQNPPAELSALRAEVTTLQLQLSSLSSELVAVQEEKKNMSQQLQDSHHQLEESRRQADRELEAARSTLAQPPPAELSALREELATLKLQLYSLSSELSGVHDAKKNMEEQLMVTQKQLVSCQKQYDSVRSEMSLERERSSSSQQALKDDLEQCASERDALEAKVVLLSGALEQETKRSASLEKQLAHYSQNNEFRDFPVQMAPELSNPMEGNSKNNGPQLRTEPADLTGEKRIADLSDPTTVPGEEAADKGDLAVLEEEHTSNSHEATTTTDTFDLFLTPGQSLVKPQGDSPSCDNLPSVTPSHDDLPSSGTPSHDDIPSSVTPSHDDLPSSGTPSHDDIPSSVTPSHDDLPSSVTLSHEEPSSVTLSHEEPSSLTLSHEEPSSVTLSHEEPSSVTLSHDEPLSVTLSHDETASVVDKVSSAQLASRSENLVANETTQVASSASSLTSDVPTRQVLVNGSTNESVVQDHTPIEDTLDFSGIPSINRLDSSRSLHKKELGTKLQRKRPSRSHLQRMGQESGITISTGDLTLERAESPEAPIPPEKPHKAAVPLPKKADSIDVSEPSVIDVSEPSCKPPTEAHKAPVPVPRPKPTPRVKDKGSKPSEEHDNATAAAVTSDGTSGSRPTSGTEDTTPLGVKHSPRPSPMSSPKPSPKHVVVKNSDNGVKGKVEEMKVQSDDLVVDHAEVKGMPRPLPKPRSTPRIAGEGDHSTSMDSKTQLDEIAGKDPSELTIKEKALLAQRMLTSKDKPKGLPPIAKKPESQPLTSSELQTDQPQLDVPSTLVSSEPLAKPKKLPPGAFSMMMPGVRKPPPDSPQPESTPGKTSLQMPGGASTAGDTEQRTPADDEMKVHKMLPTFSMVLPGGSPANVPIPPKPSIEASEGVETSSKQHVECSAEAFPQRSWSSGAKKLPPGAFNMAGGISRSGDGINRGLSGQSPQLSSEASALMTADTGEATPSELPRGVITPPSVKRSLQNVMVTPPPVKRSLDSAVVTPPPVKRSLDSAVVTPAVTQPLDSAVVTPAVTQPLESIMTPPAAVDSPLPPPPSQPLPSTSSQSPNMTPPSGTAKDDAEAEEDNVSLNDENVSTSRTEDLMADNASTDGLDLPSNDGLDYGQVLTWNATQVGKWLADAGLGQYTQAFTDRNIVGSVLLELDGAKLKSAVSDAEDRNTFKKKVKVLKAHMEKQKKAVEKQKKEEKKRQDAEKKQQKKKGK